jgi:hypothetical protein
MTQLQELLRTPATNDDPSQQLSRATAMANAAFVIKRFDPNVILSVPRALHDAYASKIAGANINPITGQPKAKPLFARGQALTFAEMPLVPNDDEPHHIIVAAPVDQVQPRHFEYANDPMHTKD